MKTSYRFLLIYYLVFSAVLAGDVCGQSKTKIQKDKVKLEDVNKKIRQQKKKLKKVKQKETRVISKLDDLEMQLIKENRGYKKVNKQIDRIYDEIGTTRKKIEQLQKQTSTKEVFLKRRLKALYKYYRRSGLVILLSAVSYNDFLKQEKLFGEIVANDYDHFRECLNALEQSRQYKSKLSLKKVELLQAKENLLKKRGAIKDTRAKKLALLKEIKHEKELQIKALKELEKYSKELQAFIDDLPKDKRAFIPSGKKFSKMKGKLNFPVKGKILSRFGRREFPELHTFTFQKGVEIKAPLGNKIKAVFEGKVVFADWFKGYGYMIIIDHGDNYYTLAAHASKLIKSVGDTVYEGETVALVGDTNSIKGPCLYFEIRHHGKPTNPLKWLKKGGNKT